MMHGRACSKVDRVMQLKMRGAHVSVRGAHLRMSSAHVKMSVLFSSDNRSYLANGKGR